jgi:hypothetical protein
MDRTEIGAGNTEILSCAQNDAEEQMQDSSSFAALRVRMKKKSAASGTGKGGRISGRGR